MRETNKEANLEWINNVNIKIKNLIHHQWADLSEKEMKSILYTKMGKIYFKKYTHTQTEREREEEFNLESLNKAAADIRSNIIIISSTHILYKVPYNSIHYCILYIHATLCLFVFACACVWYICEYIYIYIYIKEYILINLESILYIYIYKIQNR